MATGTAASAASRAFVGTFLLVLFAVAALFSADMWLARTDRVESEAEAARLFAEGQALMKSGNNMEAIERIRDAELIDRGNRSYQRTLAGAQLTAGRTTDAESTLSELLESDSTDALANLLMARVHVKENHPDDAVSYYHRAIYGRWAEDAAGNRLRTRFELIDLLAARDSKADLLSELLEVQDQAPQDAKTRMRLGRLFLQAGSPQRATSVFEEIVRNDPGNAEAHAGLGEAEFARGFYRDAERDFGVAVKLRPDDNATRQRRACDELLTLDPTIRGLGSTERYRRGRQLLEMTVQETNQCAGPNPSQELRALLDKAAAEAEKARVSAARENQATEASLDLAAQLWQIRGKECKVVADANSPLALILARLAQ